MTDDSVVDLADLFIDLPNKDYRILKNSLAENIGNPDTSYNDPDGSRNDIGAYGGEYALDWTNDNNRIKIKI
jgi:hypothetical protein